MEDWYKSAISDASLLTEPEYEWVLTFGDYPPDTGVAVYMNDAPNAIHRLMQRLVLGFHWRRL